MTIADLPEDDVVVAAEYTLGLLDGEERRSAALRRASDPLFADAVQTWTEEFAALGRALDPVKPRAGVKSAVTERLFGAAPARGGWLWPALTGLATVAAAVFALLFWQEASTPPRPSLFVAELTGTDLNAVAVVNATAHEIRLTLEGAVAPEGRDLQLWGIPDGDAPVPIGLIPEGETTAILLVPEALFGRAVGLTLAISDEPTGGSPTGQPTGDILAAAPLTGL